MGWGGDQLQPSCWQLSVGSEGGDLGLGVFDGWKEKKKNPSIQVEDIKSDYRTVPSGGVKSSAGNQKSQ